MSALLGGLRGVNHSRALAGQDDDALTLEPVDVPSFPMHRPQPLLTVSGVLA